MLLGLEAGIVVAVNGVVEMHFARKREAAMYFVDNKVG